MVTSQPIGFISYNTHDYLKHVLQTLIDSDIISRSACWYHESLGTEKNHFHCWVEPQKQIDTSLLPDKFIELDEDGNKNSIAIRPRCKSDWNNAYLYGIHDSDYLAFKGLEREEVNIKSEFHIYLGDFKADIRQAEYFRFKFCLAPYQRLKELVEQGYSLEEVYIKLRVPFAQLQTVKTAYYQILKTLQSEARWNLTEF